MRDKPSMTQLNRTLASVAQQVQNRDESKWLFDFDIDNYLSRTEFINDIAEFSNIEEDEIESFDTPNGFSYCSSAWFQHKRTYRKLERL